MVLCLEPRLVIAVTVYQVVQVEPSEVAYTLACRAWAGIQVAVARKGTASVVGVVAVLSCGKMLVVGLSLAHLGSQGGLSASALFVVDSRLHHVPSPSPPSTHEY